MQHQHYNLALAAYRNLFHTPEERAERECRDYDATRTRVAELGGDTARLERLFVAYLQAMSRTASAFITGPANFPTARNQKRQEIAHKRLMEYLDYVKGLEERHRQEAFYAANPHARPIMTSDSDAEERLQAKIAHLKALQEGMRVANSLNRGTGDKSKSLAHIQAVPELLAFVTRYGGKLEDWRGFQSFELANNLANIKRLEQRLATLHRMGTTPTPQNTRYVVDTEGKRVYFVFEGKPSEEIRNLLKSHAFKWTPSKGHWGRMLTPNALYAAQTIERSL